MSEYENITMSDRWPLRLKLADWPAIAVGEGSEGHDDSVWCLARIVVRQRGDRIVVYGTAGYQTRYSHEHGFRVFAGETGKLSNVLDAIDSVAGSLREQTEKVRHEHSGRVVLAVRDARERCIAGLAEDLD